MYTLLKKAISSKNETLAIRLIESTELNNFQKKQLLRLSLKYEPKLAPFFLSYKDIDDFLLCAEAGQVDLIETFLKHEMNVNSYTKNGKTILSELLFRETAPLSMIQLLLNHGAEIERLGQSGGTSLHFAVNTNKLEVIRLLIEHLRHLNPHYMLPENLLDFLPSRLRPETVDFVIEQGGSVSHKAIFLCLFHENEMTLQRMLHYPVAPLTLNQPFNFLSLSLHRGRPSIFERKFLECLPNEQVERQAFCTVLAMAMIDSGYLNLLPLVLEQGIEVNYVCPNDHETLVDVCLGKHEKGWAKRFRDMGGKAYRELYPPDIVPFPQ
ncbi:ankyrin repeat domain-containing protein [Exiguobacterium sp. AT1b]|uniref:ankyrin repeat domain-containing protein n=1 Tax=Exiguobacterium sp. (strain ATCC BAA-1283 / AT1b) TaxID=360911 RepID=UPI00093E61B7|nr:ankyrin repeat domain-containing protein [Exiguobacterium sp. AT1b]